MGKSPETSGGWERTAALAGVGILFFLFFSYAFVGESPFWRVDPAANANFTILALFVEKAVYLAGAAVIFAAAVSGGLFLAGLVRLKATSALEEMVFAAAIGLGALSLVTLLLGVAGILSQTAAVAVLFVFTVSGLKRWMELAGKARQRGAPEKLTWLERLLLAAGGLAALLTLVYAFNPPVNFDALEYHLGAPAAWYRQGSIRYIGHNVYSNFPGNSEMLYLFSMVLAGSKIAGAMLGKVLSAYAALAAAGACYCLGRWVFSRGAGIFAAVAVVTSMGFFQVSTGVYVEGLQTLYTVAALLAVGRFAARGGRGWLLAGGICAGLAMGVKYPSAVFVAAPLAAAVLLRRQGWARRWRDVAIFSAAALVVVAPWLVKNIVLTGNPVYPLLYGVFGGRDWSAMQDARWAMAHTPKGGVAWEQWARHIFGMIFGEGHARVSLLAFVFVPLALVKGARSRRVLYVLGYAGLYFFVWFAATHRIERFLVPAFAVVGAVSGAGLFALGKGRARRTMSALAVFLAAVSVFYLTAAYGDAPDPSVGLFGKREEFLAEKLAGYKEMKRVDELVPDGSRVMLVGAAETFYLDADFSGTTVFDRKALEEMVAERGEAGVAAALSEAGFDYVYVDWATVRRQQESYAFDYEGKRHGGYSDVLTPDLFKALVASGQMAVEYSSGGEVYPGTPAYRLYKVGRR